MTWRVTNWRRCIDHALFSLPFVARWLFSVPFATRSVLWNKRRLVRSASAIAFAISLMFLQIGFRGAFLDSATDVIRKIDADLFLISSTKYHFDLEDSFSRRQLYAARGVYGVESVRPIYADVNSRWKNPQSKKIYIVRVLAFDPDQPVFLLPEITAKLAVLKQADTAMFDSRSRRNIGFAHEGMTSELERRKVRIVGTFHLGPNFSTDGTLILSDRNFEKILSDRVLDEHGLPDIEFGVVKVQRGFDLGLVQQALRRALPPNISVLTKPELIDLEIRYQNELSPAGPLFTLGTVIGFVFGMLISYQCLYSELSEQLPQYATLKAIGYNNAYLVRVVVEQAIIYAFVGYFPAIVLSAFLYKVIGEFTLLPLQMSLGVAVSTALLTIAMCVASGLLAMYRVLAADPAEVF